MSGHSKWASIKHKKAAVDAKRGKIFSKLIKELTVAARIGGGDPTANPRLRTAISTAKGVNMPNENIERAIKKGTGELPGTSYEEVSYEGYGPGGAAVMLEVMTDNKNRTVAEIRSIFAKNGGSLGETGCVNWMFEKKGLIAVPKETVGEDELMAVALDAGAEDFKVVENAFEILTSPEDFERIKKAIQDKHITPAVAQISMIPQSTVKLADNKARQMLKLMDLLEDHDDVQEVYSNFDIPDEILEAVG
jgi:YebC/PmpR family DNA-binding regulatory protein